MVQLSANISLLFVEHDFLDRYTAASRAGFRAIENMFPYEYDVSELKSRLEDNNLRQVLFNLPAGNWSEGDRGIAAHPRRVQEFKEGIDVALEYARILEVNQLNCLAGKLAPDFSYEEQWDTLVNNLMYASDKLEKEGILLLVEPVNTFDVPGFLINTTKDILKLKKDMGRTNLKYQYDMYHMQRMEGELINTVKANLDIITHIQISDTPGRHQPGTGEINYRFIFKELDKMNYKGHVGLDYNPHPDTISSLEWIEEYGLEL